MSKAALHSVGHKAEAGNYVLVGSYAGSPHDWWIAMVVYVDPRLDELVVRRSDPTGSKPSLQPVPKDLIRAVAQPTAMQIAAEEHGELAAAIGILSDFRAQAVALTDKARAQVAEAEARLDAARKAMWSTLDSLYAEEPAHV